VNYHGVEYFFFIMGSEHIRTAFTFLNKTSIFCKTVLYLRFSITSFKIEINRDQNGACKEVSTIFSNRKLYSDQLLQKHCPPAFLQHEFSLGGAILNWG
jgi:hypothetical protein